MSDNPFDEPDEDERTVIRPLSGRPVPAAASVPPQAPGAAAVGDGPGFEVVDAVGPSRLVAAAYPLLALLGRLRNVASAPDPEGLREHAILELRRYETRLRADNVPMEQLRPAHYAICASLDDVVQATPWGSRGVWANSSLVSTFHQEVKSGERFFDLIARLCQHPGKFLDVLELAYFCISLGMQGRYRVSSRGPAELERVREELYALLMRHRSPAERALSPHWMGVSAPYRPTGPVVPLWVAALAGLGLVALIYAISSLRLNDASDRVFAASQQLRPLDMPAIARAAPPQPVAAAPQAHEELDRLNGFFAPEIRDGLVTIAGTEAIPVVRISSRGMFRSGSASVEPRFLPLLKHIGAVLHDEPGAVQIVGYTDNAPVHTVRFPSNFQLSAARAGAAAAIIGAGIGEPGRLSTEGRADAEPIASNATPEGREQNRRTDVVLHRTRKEGPAP
jgi:type VI secretion system protein ImpK